MIIVCKYCKKPRSLNYSPLWGFFVVCFVVCFVWVFFAIHNSFDLLIYEHLINEKFARMLDESKSIVSSTRNICKSTSIESYFKRHLNSHKQYRKDISEIAQGTAAYKD